MNKAKGELDREWEVGMGGAGGAVGGNGDNCT